MNEDLKTRIDEAVESQVPFSLDLDGLVAGERRRHRRRVGLGIGGAATAVVAVVALVLALGPGPADVADPGPATSRDPEVDELPTLGPDPRDNYTWVGNSKQGTPAETYTDAFQSYSDSHWPDAELDWTLYEHDGAQAEPSEDPPGINQLERELLSYDANETIYSYEYLTVQQEMTVDGETNFQSGLQLQFGDDIPNFVVLEVHPAGSFTIGDDGFFDLARCDDEYKVGPVECDTAKTEGPDGEKIYNTESRMLQEGGDMVRYLEYRTVIVRQDGSAVVASDLIVGKDLSTSNTDVAGAVPQLGFEDLTGLGLALPLDPIR